MKVRFPASAPRECGVFLDFAELLRLHRGGSFMKFLPSQKIRARFPTLVAADPMAYDERVFFSHRWDTWRHPDPTGWQLEAVVEYARELQQLGRDGCFWYDFASLPQKPRTAREAVEFRVSLPNIGFLCRTCTTVPLISGDAPDVLTNTKAMLGRGWILFEQLIASMGERLAAPMFECGSPLDRLSHGKVQNIAWRSVLPAHVDALPYYGEAFILSWFRARSIRCRNGSDLKLLARLLARHLFDAHGRHQGRAKPAALAYGTTTRLTDAAIAHYRIDRHGLSALFPTTHFGLSRSPDGVSYAVTPRRRPRLGPLRTPRRTTSAHFGKLAVDPATRTSPMYPGLVFDCKPTRGKMLVYSFDLSP